MTHTFVVRENDPSPLGYCGYPINIGGAGGEMIEEDLQVNPRFSQGFRKLTSSQVLVRKED